MKENKTSEKIKHFARKKWDNFAEWFTDKEHPHSRLNKNVFFHDSLKLIGLILVFLIIYSNLDKINQIVLIFIKLGSLLQLVLLFFILRKAWHLTINLKYAFRGLNHGTKAIIAIVIVLLLFFAFVNQDSVVNSITQTYEEANFSKLNPIQVSGNFSLFGSDKNSSSSSILNKISTPTIEELSQNPKNYVGKNISVKGNLILAPSLAWSTYSLKDKNNYYIFIEPNSCVWGVQRQYKYDGTEKYAAEGIFLEKNTLNHGNIYYLKCSKSLE